MKVIMVPVADRPECKIALNQTFLLAKQLSGNVIGCHLRPHRSEASAPRAGRFRIRIGGDRTVPVRVTERGLDLRRERAKKLFLRLADDHGFRILKRPRLGFERGALWFELVGGRDKLFSIAGPVADLSVVSRPQRAARGHGHDFLLSALLNTGRPVLVLPQTATSPVGKRILIAWNQSVEAARAVSAALPLLTRAQAVHVCSCGPENRPGPKSTNLKRYLTFWGVRCTRSSSVGRNVPQELEAVYRETSSDLVVMGAYSRNRIREIVFGGVTEYMLFHTTKPVFALHL